MVDREIIMYLTLETGEVITATDGHPFKTTEGWRDAILLKKGGKLLLKGAGEETGPDQAEGGDNERRVTIADVRIEHKTVKAYNLEVANAHTFFVGEDGVLVHNGRCPPSLRKQSAAKGGVQVTEKGIARVESHAAQFGNDPANAVMIERLRAGHATPQDLTFYMHELKESSLMRQGLSDRAAHLETLKWQGIEYKAGYEAKIYHPDAIRAGGSEFSPAARKAAGIE
ncbi:hypothetical protein AGMMS49545_23470 [Betaproteobacteria bacterium]|nr:hypothetical protein AGMMS49545_23470 [Betaproteobacteria bacterium]GHU43047.1 hypothetical protein AGMMS50289_08780 [Betaproteobacteria bacterium]